MDTFRIDRLKLFLFSLILLLILLVSCLSSLLILSYLKIDKATKSEASGAVKSQRYSDAGKISVAGTILGSMDMTVDPCQDFYQFSNGRAVEKAFVSLEKQYRHLGRDWKL